MPMLVGLVRDATPIRPGCLLEIVRRQPVLFRGDEDLEVAPGPPGQLVQESPLRVGQADRRRGERPAQPPGDERRDEPQTEQRPGDQEHDGFDTGPAASSP